MLPCSNVTGGELYSKGTVDYSVLHALIAEKPYLYARLHSIDLIYA